MTEENYRIYVALNELCRSLHVKHLQDLCFVYLFCERSNFILIYFKMGDKDCLSAILILIYGEKKIFNLLNLVLDS